MNKADTAALAPAHALYVERLWRDIQSYPYHLRQRVFNMNAKDMRDGGRGIYTAQEASILRARLEKGVEF